MELVPDETVLSCSEDTTPGSDDLIEEIVRRTPPLSGSRVLRAPSLRRRTFQSEHECGVPYQTHTYSFMPVHDGTERHFSDASTSSTLTFVTTASYSTDPWSTSGFVDGEPAMDRSSDEPEDFSTLLKPKIEMPDDDVQMDELQEAEVVNAAETSTSVFRPKRPRGRPRKYPIQSLEVSVKVQKGRSKTGCITCRRRKKKCDETKPHCELTATIVCNH